MLYPLPVSISCSLRTRCSSGGCSSSTHPPVVGFPRKRDKPESRRGCFQMVCTYIQSNCIWVVQGRLQRLLYAAHVFHCRGPLILPAGGFHWVPPQDCPQLKGTASPGLCSLSAGGEPSVSNDWLVWGYKPLPFVSMQDIPKSIPHPEIPVGSP